MGDVCSEGVKTDVDRDIECEWSYAAKRIPLLRGHAVTLAEHSRRRQGRPP